MPEPIDPELTHAVHIEEILDQLLQRNRLNEPVYNDLHRLLELCCRVVTARSYTGERDDAVSELEGYLR